VPPDRGASRQARIACAVRKCLRIFPLIKRYGAGLSDLPQSSRGGWLPKAESPIFPGAHCTEREAERSELRVAPWQVRFTCTSANEFAIFLNAIDAIPGKSKELHFLRSGD